jgi:hypothetical protein
VRDNAVSAQLDRLRLSLSIETNDSTRGVDPFKDAQSEDDHSIHREDDLLRVATGSAVVEVQPPVDPLVAAFLVAGGNPSANQRKRPRLKLELRSPLV